MLGGDWLGGCGATWPCGCNIRVFGRLVQHLDLHTQVQKCKSAIAAWLRRNGNEIRCFAVWLARCFTRALASPFFSFCECRFVRTHIQTVNQSVTQINQAKTSHTNQTCRFACAQPGQPWPGSDSQPAHTAALNQSRPS